MVEFMPPSFSPIAITADAWLLLGLAAYLIAAGAGAAMVPDRFARIIAELEASPALTLFGGVITLALGIAMLGLATGAPLRLIAALAVAKGVLLIINPPGLTAAYRRIVTADNGRAWGIVLIVIGISATLLALR